MSLIAVKSLALPPGTDLFRDLSFTLSAGDRLGLIAANGRGKTSLLRCLAGQLEPTTAEITRARGLTVGLVEQDVPAALPALSLRDAAGMAGVERPRTGASMGCRTLWRCRKPCGWRRSERWDSRYGRTGGHLWQPRQLGRTIDACPDCHQVETHFPQSRQSPRETPDAFGPFRQAVARVCPRGSRPPPDEQTRRARCKAVPTST